VDASLLEELIVSNKPFKIETASFSSIQSALPGRSRQGVFVLS